MQEKEDQPRQSAYSYSQQAFAEAALAPGQYSIGTGGQDWIGSNKLTDGRTGAFTELDVELNCSDSVFVGVHELLSGSPSFRPPPPNDASNKNNFNAHLSCFSSLLLTFYVFFSACL